MAQTSALISLSGAASAMVATNRTHTRVGLSILGPNLAETWCAHMTASEARQLAAALNATADQIDTGATRAAGTSGGER